MKKKKIQTCVASLLASSCLASTPIGSFVAVQSTVSAEMIVPLSNGSIEIKLTFLDKETRRGVFESLNTTQQAVLVQEFVEKLLCHQKSETLFTEDASLKSLMKNFNEKLLIQEYFEFYQGNLAIFRDKNQPWIRLSEEERKNRALVFGLLKEKLLKSAESMKSEATPVVQKKVVISPAQNQNQKKALPVIKKAAAPPEKKPVVQKKEVAPGKNVQEKPVVQAKPEKKISIQQKPKGNAVPSVKKPVLPVGKNPQVQPKKQEEKVLPPVGKPGISVVKPPQQIQSKLTPAQPLPSGNLVKPLVGQNIKGKIPEQKPPIRNFKWQPIDATIAKPKPAATIAKQPQLTLLQQFEAAKQELMTQLKEQTQQFQNELNLLPELEFSKEVLAIPEVQKIIESSDLKGSKQILMDFLPPMQIFVAIDKMGTVEELKGYPEKRLNEWAQLKKAYFSELERTKRAIQEFQNNKEGLLERIRKESEKLKENLRMIQELIQQTKDSKSEVPYQQELVEQKPKMEQFLVEGNKLRQTCQNVTDKATLEAMKGMERVVRRWNEDFKDQLLPLKERIDHYQLTFFQSLRAEFFEVREKFNGLFSEEITKELAIGKPGFLQKHTGLYQELKGISFEDKKINPTAASMKWMKEKLLPMKQVLMEVQNYRRKTDLLGISSLPTELAKGDLKDLKKVYLGEGGFGKVWGVTVNDEKYALKELGGSKLTKAQLQAERKRCLAKARDIERAGIRQNEQPGQDFARMQGFGGIVRNLGENGDFLIQPLIHGKDGRSSVNGASGLYGKFAGQPRNLKETLRIVQTISSIMMSVHEAGYVHCDLKMENVMFSYPENGEVQAFVIDFDGAKTVNQTHDLYSLNGGPEYVRLIRQIKKLEKEVQSLSEQIKISRLNKKNSSDLESQKTSKEKLIREKTCELSSVKAHFSYDVYSFGAMLPEILFGRPGQELYKDCLLFDEKLDSDPYYDWIVKQEKFIKRTENRELEFEDYLGYWQKKYEGLNNQLFQSTAQRYSEQQIQSFSRLTAWMLQQNPEHRPTMAQVFSEASEWMEAVTPKAEVKKSVLSRAAK